MLLSYESEIHPGYQLVDAIQLRILRGAFKTGTILLLQYNADVFWSELRSKSDNSDCSRH